MIIVKWHLLIWHKRKLCALTNRPPAQSTRSGQWLSKLFDANCPAAHVYVLHPWQFIFALSCRRRSVLQVFLSSESQEGYFKTFFVYLMMTNVMVRACLIFNQEIIKIWIWLREKVKNNACPRSKFNRRPKLSESRIWSNTERSEDPKCGLNTRHDNREVTLTYFTYLTQAQTLRSDK